MRARAGGRDATVAGGASADEMRRALDPPGTGVSARKGTPGIRAGLAVFLALAASAFHLGASERRDGPPQATPIPAGSLDRALAVLLDSGRIQIAYPSALTRGRSTRGAPGGLPPAVTLARLLAGTGLRAVEVSPGAFVVREVEAPAAAVPRPQSPETPGGAIEDIGRIQVVGSRIPRQPLESSVPVTIISREQIESGGYQSLYALLRVEPGMVGHDPVDVALDGGMGQVPMAGPAAASRSVFGPRATLFLLNGQRLAAYPQPSASLGALPDLDAIPITLVERVEILRGGSSSVYGSDAMAGVVNIVLRDDLQGAVSARLGVSGQGDADQWRVFARQAFGDEHGSLTVSFDHHSRSGLLGGARNWRTLDRRRDGLRDQRIELGTEEADYPYLFLSPGICPPGADADGRCFLDAPRLQSLLPEQRSTTLQLQSASRTASDVRLYANLHTGIEYKRLQSAPIRAWINRYPVYPYQNLTEGSTAHAFFDAGPVSTSWRSRRFALQAGASGDLAHGRWEVALSSAGNRLDARVRGAISLSGLFSALDDGSYVLGAPDNDAAILRRVSPVLESEAASYQHSISAGAYARLFEWRAGAVRGSVGAEARREGQEARPDPRVEAGDVILENQAARRRLRRDTLSAYGELSIPAAQRLLFDASWRVDKAGDASARFSPKYGFRLDLHPRLRLIGSIGEGYRAPTLYELRKPLDQDFVEFLLRVGPLADCAVLSGPRYCRLGVTTAENASLRPETSSSRIAGVTWEPVDGTRLDISHYRIDRNNEIRTSVSQDAFVHPELLVRNAEGKVTGILKTFINEGTTRAAGWEWGLAHSHDLGPGKLDLEVRGESSTRLYRSAGDHVAGPRDTALATLDWMLSDWNYHLDMRRVGSSAAWDPTGPCPAEQQKAVKCRNPAFLLVGVGVAYAGWPGLVVRLNVANVLDRRPRNYFGANGGYDIAYDDSVGRYLLLSLSSR